MISGTSLGSEEGAQVLAGNFVTCNGSGVSAVILATLLSDEQQMVVNLASLTEKTKSATRHGERLSLSSEHDAAPDNNFSSSTIMKNIRHNLNGELMKDMLLP